MLDTCDLFQIKNYTYTHKFWIPHIFSILVSFLFNFFLKKLRFVSIRFSANILRCIWLDRKNLTTRILLLKIVLTQLSTSFSGPRRLALAWIGLFFLLIHASTSIFTTVSYLAALTRGSNWQYVVKSCSEHEYKCTLELFQRNAQLSKFFLDLMIRARTKINCRINENVIVDFCRYLACNKE